MFETKKLKRKRDYLAPDKSEIRLLLKVKGGNLWHCTLPQGRTSWAVSHKSVDEIWFFTSGHGEVWRSDEKCEKIVDVQEGKCITIPAGTAFQFRNNGTDDLKFIGVTIPSWPGQEEAVEENGHWKIR